ncbi:MAG: hypothetical protein V4613_05810 [Bacteroidota bacterium]
MKTCCYFLTLLFVVFSTNSCSNEIEVLADYEENASVYGVLDPSQPVQFIKINKVFTNPNSPAKDVAKVADSLYFDSLAPTLTEIETGRVIYLYRANVLLKDSGYFANSPNYLYATTEKVYARNPNKPAEFLHYRLDLRLPKSQKYITAITDISDPVRLTSPTSVFVPSSMIDFPYNANFRILFNSPIGSKIFDGYFYFNYQEVNKNDTNIKVNKTVKWRVLNNIRTIDTKGNESISSSIKGSSFYDMLLTRIPNNPDVTRRFLPCNLELTAGNLELDNYIQSTEPSIGIVQKQTEYTNITRALGIFASRRITLYSNLKFGDNSRYILLTDPTYKSLAFTK